MLRLIWGSGWLSHNSPHCNNEYPSWELSRFKLSLDNRCRQLVRQHDLHFMLLSETFQSVDKSTSFLQNQGFCNVIGMYAVGNQGGLVLVWTQEYTLLEKQINAHWIHVTVLLPDHSKLLLTEVYGPLKIQNRHVLWNFTRNTFAKNSDSNLPWLLFGDFNRVFFVQNKCSSNTNLLGATSFQETLFSYVLLILNLQEIGSHGPIIGKGINVFGKDWIEWFVMKSGCKLSPTLYCKTYL